MRLTKFLFFLAAFAGSVYATELDAAYDKEAERAKILRQMEDWQPSKVEVVNYKKASKKKKEFIDFYLKEIVPINAHFSEKQYKASLLYIALDRGLYRNEVEKKSWQAQQMKMSNEAREIFYSERFSSIIKKMGKLAQGIEGKMAKDARRESRLFIRLRPREGEKEVTQELDALSIKETELRNSSTFNMHIGDASKKLSELGDDYIDGKITFSELMEQIKEVQKNGSLALGNDIYEKTADIVNRQAVLRTKIANMKGFKTWAEYQIFLQEGYSRSFRSVSWRKKFLEDILTETRPAIKEILLEAKRHVPELAAVPLEDLKGYEVSYLLGHPYGKVKSPLLKYPLPKDVVGVWKQTMKESGFKEEMFSHLTLDSYPREGKNSHAYMLPIRVQEAKTYKIDAQKLEFKLPPNSKGRYSDPIVHIVQNFRHGSAASLLNNYNVIFHEGGHFVDSASRETRQGASMHNSSYSETNSAFMEKFLKDPEWMAAHHRHIDSGKAPSKEFIEEVLALEELGELLNNRTLLRSSLYDIELWDFPYTEGGETFTGRASKIMREHHEKYSFGRFQRLVEEFSPLAGTFNTSHFTSGRVDYIGYVLASIAADGVEKKVLDDLEKATGRRSLYKQKSLAKTLVDGMYRHGHGEAFPKQVEQFTGKKYSTMVGKGAMKKKLYEHVNKIKANRSGHLKSLAESGTKMLRAIK